MYYIDPTKFIDRFSLFIEEDTRVNLKLFLTNYGQNFEFAKETIGFRYTYKCIDYYKKSIYAKLPRWFVYHTSEFTLQTIMIDKSLSYELTFNKVYHMYLVAFHGKYPANKSIKREFKKFQKEYPEYII